ncbi:MAG: TonB-dependent receptor plug domain-containing protein [Saprospiraceae bacterium]|nr:TonB-dependent receptor plug domain-containing protein [Saprospiraceae bacterium]
MKKLKILLVFFTLSAVFSAFSFIQTDDLSEKILGQLMRYMRETPQEKVYLHLDKPYYMAGETMWYKGYLFDAATHNIDSVSRVLYVDLIDPSVGKVLMHQILKCEKGMTDGSFKLPDTLSENIYTLRAYTNYMRNFSEDWFFQKPVKVWQGSVKSRADYTQMTDVADCQFFPEGGYMVNGLEGRMAFKAVNAAGRGLDVEGVLFENDKDTVSAFKSAHLGMGFFYYKPQAGKKYSVKLRRAGSLEQSNAAEWTYNLPEAQAQGLTLAVDNTTNRTNIKVFINNTHPQSADKVADMVIVAHQRGIPCFTVKLPNTKPNGAVNIPRTMIPDDGIVQITLFDTEGVPRCERLVFVQKNKTINLKLTADKTEYKPREKVTLLLEATDSLGKPVVGNFSLAATDGAQVLGDKNGENLMSYLFLSSDLNGKDAVLRGVVEEPAYYFDKTQKAATRDLDVLMMTQGWRRFVWQDILSEKLPKLPFPIEQGLSVTGKAVRPNGKITSKPINITFMIGKVDKKPILQLATADSLGQFGFYNLDFTDTTSVFVQAVKEKGLGVLNVTLDKVTRPQVAVTKIPFNTLFFDAQAFADFLKTTRETLEFEKKLQLNKEKMLETVEVKAKKKEPLDERRIYNRASNTIDMKEINCGSYFSILDIIQGRVPGVQIMGMGADAQVIIRGGSSVNFRLDGMPVDLETIQTIPVCDIEAIDILKGPDAAIFGLTGGDGVIAVLTKRGNPNYDYSNDSSPVGIVVQKRQGYTPRREFYAPRYDESKPEHEFKDFRATLHWQPYVQTDANGKAVVVFWNSDARTKINVVAEGVSKAGRVGVGSCDYWVK